MNQPLASSHASSAPARAREIPYKIAVLAYIFNAEGKLLLLHRKKPPNQDLYSPVGGKLEQQLGESPYACALREIAEEVGVALTLPDIRLLGIVSERAYAWNARTTPSAVATRGEPAAPDAAHWLMFCFEVTQPLSFPPRQIEEGRLEWVEVAKVAGLSIPKTDREVIWPLVQRHSRILRGENAGSFFSVHIDCTDVENFVVTREH
jgi:8-oxo-dGTP diphosphatase